jgi:hypothetical protein
MRLKNRRQNYGFFSNYSIYNNSFGRFEIDGALGALGLFTHWSAKLA